MAFPSVHVFCDFDGTIAVNDLGDKLFEDFGRFQPLHWYLEQGMCTVAQYWRAVCATLPADIREQDVRQWACAQPADPSFGKFAAFCAEHGVPLTVVSDGFEQYIRVVVEREITSLIGTEQALDSDAATKVVAHVDICCNTLVWTCIPNTITAQRQNICRSLETAPSVQPVFWGANESCSCFCASCKRNALLTKAAPEALIVYIGDGYSDFCAVEHADIVFAKKALAAYCNAERIPHYPFSTFDDVLMLLQQALRKKRLKPRRQAALKRKEAFERE
jgi:2-hydroxy-3-keto-5-methylthiopentenyl-1-phosphate phosphatase